MKKWKNEKMEESKRVRKLIAFLECCVFICIFAAN